MGLLSFFYFCRMGISRLHRWGLQLYDALFPQCCALCERQIGPEYHLCEDCVRSLERTHLHRLTDNAIARLLQSELPIQRAASLLRYRPDSPVSELMLNIKYYNRPQLAVSLGRWMAQELAPMGMFEGIDFIVPMPLTPQRQRERGYNQSERLAHGVSLETGLPVRQDVAERHHFVVSQTRLTGEERRANVRDAFRATPQGAELCRGHHVLLIDDVMTTGSSLRHLGLVLPDCTISTLTLALAGTHRTPVLTDTELEREQQHQTTEVVFDDADTDIEYLFELQGHPSIPNPTTAVHNPGEQKW